MSDIMDAMNKAYRLGQHEMSLRIAKKIRAHGWPLIGIRKAANIANDMPVFERWTTATVKGKEGKHE